MGIKSEGEDTQIAFMGNAFYFIGLTSAFFVMIKYNADIIINASNGTKAKKECVEQGKNAIVKLYKLEISLEKMGKNNQTHTT